MGLKDNVLGKIMLNLTLKWTSGEGDVVSNIKHILYDSRRANMDEWSYDTMLYTQINVIFI